MRRPAALLALIFSAGASLATSQPQSDGVGGMAEGPAFTLSQEQPVRRFLLGADANSDALKHSGFRGSLGLAIELIRPDDGLGPGGVGIEYSTDLREYEWNDGLKGPFGVAAGETRRLFSHSVDAFQQCKKGEDCSQALDVTFTHTDGGPVEVKWTGSASLILDDDGERLPDAAEIIVTLTDVGGG